MTKEEMSAAAPDELRAEIVRLQTVIDECYQAEEDWKESCAERDDQIAELNASIARLYREQGKWQHERDAAVEMLVVLTAPSTTAQMARDVILTEGHPDE